jgi:tetratricopeptide (TPR) repeat protein
MTRLLFFLFLLPVGFISAQENVQQALKLAGATDFDGARKMLETIVDRDDRDSDAHFQLGKILLDHYQELDAAQDHLERAVELADGRAEYHFVLGRAYGAIAQNGGMFTGMKYAGKVKDQFIRAVELEPNSIVYRTGLMRYYIQAPAIVGGSIAKAREQADAMLRLDPYEGHMAFALIAVSEKDQKAAETEYKGAIAVDPKNPRAYFRLGYLYLGQKRVDEALMQFRQYAKWAPDDPNSHDSLGEALLEKGSYDEALREYDKALALNPRYPSSLYGTARCYEGKGIKSEALSSYRKFLALDPKGESAETARKRVEELQR